MDDVSAAREILVIESDSPAATERLGERLGGALVAGEAVLLEGELGAGKTCFVRGLARGLGADDRAVASPTYVISHEYPGERATLVHVDAYRLDEGDDLESLGIDAEGSVAAIEWAERLVAGRPEGLVVRFEHVGPEARRIVFSGGSTWVERIRAIAE